MENEIKVGEYIRTKLGDIKQITEGFEFIIERHNKSFNNIVKHSPNLTDIIEENDIGIMNCYGLIVKKFLTMDDIFGLKTKEYELLELVTKEQFEYISYKVTKM
jgi:hypothetical protein